MHARRFRQLIDGDLIVFQPFRIRLPRRKLPLDLLVRDDAPLDRVHQEHFSRLQTTLALHLLSGNVEHSRLRSHHHQAVMRDDVAAGAETVAIESRPDYTPVGEGDRGRTVPGLHHARVIFVKRAFLRFHVRVARPRLGNQHGHHVRQAAPPLKQ